MKQLQTADSKDSITMDVPLLIRLLELAREDLKSDVELHNVVERIIDVGASGELLTMDHYSKIAGNIKGTE